MYRIELTPGEITVFRTIEELATGVRNGVITSKARIHHSASEKWLPIEFHPHYKQALELLAGRGANSQAPKSAERSSGSALVFLNVPISPLATIPPAPAAQAPTPPVAPEPAMPAAQAPTPPVVPEPVMPAAQAPTPQVVPESVMPAAPIDRPTFHKDETEGGSSDEERGVHHLRVHASPAVEAPIHSASTDEAEGREVPAHHSPMHHSRVEEEPVRHSPVHALPTHESPVDYSPLYDLPVDESPVQQSTLHETSTRSSAVRVPPVKAPVLEERLVEPPRPRPTLEELFAPPTTQRPPALPSVSASPVLELPKISYPEFTPAEPPVAERSSGGARARRPLHLAGAVILLAAGGYVSTMVFPFGRSDGGFSAASTMADRPIVPARASAPRASAGAATPVAPRTASPSTPVARPPAPSPATGPVARPPAPSPATGPAAVAPSRAQAALPADDTPLPPASSGFAPALEPRAMVASPEPAPKPDAADSTAVAAPAIDMDVAAPTLQAADSLAGPPRQKGDSAMKKILRALNGGKALP